jgi:hypothetical protein
LRPSATLLAASVALVLAGSASAATSVLFLDRCAAGCTYTPGFDDSRSNVSSLISQTSVLPAYPYGDDSWNAVVACVRETYAPFDVRVTDVDPGSAEHFEVAVAGLPQDLGLSSGIGNVSPVTCSGSHVVVNGIAFAFAASYSDAPLEICWSAAQAAGSLFGLDHELLAGDVMTFLSGSLPKAFLDETASCGESSARSCLCGGTTQNSYQELLTTLPEPGAPGLGLAAGVALAAVAHRRRS